MTCLVFYNIINNMIDEKTKKILELQAEICAALSNITRLEIIFLIKEEEKSVSDIALELGISMSNLSQHLKILKEKGLVKHRKEGQHIYYSVANETVRKLCETMREFVKRNIREFASLKESLV